MKMITFIFIYAWISFYKETFQMFSSFFYQVTSLFFLRTFPVVIFFCNSLLSLIFALYFIVVLLLHFFLSFIYPHRESPSPFRPNFAILFIIKGCWKLSNLFSFHGPHCVCFHKHESVLAIKHLIECFFFIPENMPSGPKWGESTSDRNAFSGN